MPIAYCDTCLLRLHTRLEKSFLLVVYLRTFDVQVKCNSANSTCPAPSLHPLGAHSHTAEKNVRWLAINACGTEKSSLCSRHAERAERGAVFLSLLCDRSTFVSPARAESIFLIPATRRYRTAMRTEGSLCFRHAGVPKAWPGTPAAGKPAHRREQCLRPLSARFPPPSLSSAEAATRLRLACTRSAIKSVC